MAKRLRKILYDVFLSYFTIKFEYFVLLSGTPVWDKWLHTRHHTGVLPDDGISVKDSPWNVMYFLLKTYLWWCWSLHIVFMVQLSFCAYVHNDTKTNWW